MEMLAHLGKCEDFFRNIVKLTLCLWHYRVFSCFCSFGNMMTYLTSYMRQHGSPDLTYGDFIVVQSVWGVTQGLVMPLSGHISRSH